MHWTTERTAVMVTPFESWTEHQLSWSLFSSFIMRNVARRLLGQGICPVCLSLEGGTDNLLRNVGRHLSTYAPWNPRREKASIHRGGSLQSRTDYPDIGLSWFSWILKGNYRAVPRRAHDHVVPNPPQFNFHQSTLCTRRYWRLFEDD